MGLLGILCASNPAPTPRRRRRSFAPSLHPGTESLESRVVLSHAVAEVAAPAAVAGGFVINSVNLTSLAINNGVLTATGTVTGLLAGQEFTADITNFALRLIPDNLLTPAVECSVLDLELGPIDLDLLGLHVDTSRICLGVTAIDNGGLLGDLLCGLAGGLPLGILPDLGDLTGAVQDILNNVFSQGMENVGPPSGGTDICDGECEILDLALGPVDLTLLGLNVTLDNCEDPAGPVQVCVSASRGEGLLGNLLCGLTGSQVINLTFDDITTLGNRATELLADGTLSPRDAGQLTALLGRLIR